MKAISDPLSVPGDLWNGVTPLWSSTNPDGSPVTAKQRGEALSNLGGFVEPLLEPGLPTRESTLHEFGVPEDAAGLREKADELGIDATNLDDFRNWLHSQSGKDYVARFEKYKRTSPQGQMDFVHPKTGVQFKNGYPVFDPRMEVKIEPTGSRWADKRAANSAAGIRKAPKGYVWHHHEKSGIMQLVDSASHGGTGHGGGHAIWSKRR